MLPYFDPTHSSPRSFPWNFIQIENYKEGVYAFSEALCVICEQLEVIVRQHRVTNFRLKRFFFSIRQSREWVTMQKAIDSHFCFFGNAWEFSGKVLLTPKSVTSTVCLLKYIHFYYCSFTRNLIGRGEKRGDENDAKPASSLWLCATSKVVNISQKWCAQYCCDLMQTSLGESDGNWWEKAVDMGVSPQNCFSLIFWWDCLHIVHKSCTTFSLYWHTKIGVCFYQVT